jgi:group I intron endonuclease
MEQSAFTGYIYLITNLVTGKKYIGCTTVSLKRRWAQHLSSARKGSSMAIHRAIRKYGVGNFEIKCLEVVATREAMLAAEVSLIYSHGCTAPNGYNLTNGGEGVDFSVPEAREKLMQGASKRKADPNWHKACSEGSRRRSSSPEWKQNVTLAAKVRAQDSECQAKLRDGVRKRTADPSWRKNVADGARKRASDPLYREACSKGAQGKLSNPDWRTANLEQLSTQHADSEWQKSRIEGLRKGRAIVSARAVARDAVLPLSLQLQRARRREQGRKYQANKRARKSQDNLKVLI